MKKNGVKIFIILVLALIVTVGAYMFVNNKHNNNNPTQSGSTNRKKGEVRFLNSKLEENVIIQKYKVYINGKTIDLEIKYNYKINNLPYDDDSGYSREEVVEGKMNGITMFLHQVKNNSTSQKAALFETGKIDKEFNDKYFRVVRGTDGKDYIAVSTHIYDEYNKPRANYLYILNDNLKVINEIFDDETECTNMKSPMIVHPGLIGLLSSKDIWYNNEFKHDNLQKNHISVKVEDDKIYYLFHNLKQKNIEERVYTIADDKLSYKTSNIYKADASFGDVCYEDNVGE